MCRVLAYLGRPLRLSHLLFETDNGLVHQAHAPTMTSMLNLAGFGVAAWEPRSAEPEEPFLYRSTTVPVFDRNLRNIAHKLEPSCVLAHVRGIELANPDVLTEVNLHPFRQRDANVLFAHNGHLREFDRMRYDLLPHIRPEVRERTDGTNDTAWLYAVLLSQLDEPYGMPGTEELAQATLRTLDLVRDIRARHGIDTSSPTNLFAMTSRSAVATRFSYDYGWYPAADSLLEVDLPFVSLWYTQGDVFCLRDGEWTMSAAGPDQSLIVASEPLTADVSSWLEVPEYTLLAATLSDGDLTVELRDLDV